MAKSWTPTLPPFTKHKKKVFAKASKVASFIYQIGELPALRQPSKPVPIDKITSSEYKKRFQYVKTCLLRYRRLTGAGRGITAVQIGVPEHFSVIYTPETLLVIVNPHITKKSKKFLRYPEICMSANPIIAPVVRPAWIEFEYFDEKGRKQFWKTKDTTKLGRILNRVFQHEIDHMDGIINIDKVDSKDLILESDPTFYDKATFEKI